MLLDIVGLRRINLAHGHKAGDEVLAQLARRLRAAVRGNDAVGRLGGDELAVLLVGAIDDQAVLRRRKILHRIPNEPIKVDDEPTDDRRSDARAVTELASGERSGEAALAARYGGLRSWPRPARSGVAVDDRRRSTSDAGGDNVAQSRSGTALGGDYRVRPRAVARRDGRGLPGRGPRASAARSRSRCCARTCAAIASLVARFRAEAAILASLHHRNLVQVYALGEHAGDVYFVMELVEGQPLSEVLRATARARRVVADRGGRADRARDRRRARRDARGSA